jgi:hypothetical protein
MMNRRTILFAVAAATALIALAAALPDWSPDGSKIAYEDDAAGNGDIYPPARLIQVESSTPRG